MKIGRNKNRKLSYIPSVGIHESNLISNPPMMTYDYHCERCGKNFSVKQTLEEHEKKKVKCPDCGSIRVKHKPEPFFAKTSKKS